jgi:GNAT superfamily N-acetyltransferase
MVPTNDLVIRPARAGEAATLSELAMRSKAHWGYDAAFMETVRPILTFSEDDIIASPVYVLDDAGTPIGMYRITGTPPSGELEDLWLEPSAIGRGHGRRMFEHSLATAAELGFDELTIEAEPNATGFYAAMGAVQVGERRSPSGRTLALLNVRTR